MTLSNARKAKQMRDQKEDGPSSCDSYRVTTLLSNDEHPTPDQEQGSLSLEFQFDSLDRGSS